MEPQVRAIELRERVTAGRWSRALGPVRSPFGTLAAAATAATLAAVVLETGGVVTQVDAFTALVVWSSVSIVAAGVFVQTWRPGNPLGSLLVVDGLLTAGHGLQGSTVPALFALGLLVEAPATFILFYVLLAWPSGRLQRPARIALAAVGAFFAFAFVPRLFVTWPVSGGSPLAACGKTCPDNPLLLVRSESVRDVMSHFVPISRLLAVGAVAAVLVLQLVRASRPRRRMLVPVATVGLVWVGLLALFGTIQAYAGHAAAASIGYGVVLARAMLPAAFLLAPLQARAFSGLALQRMLRRFDRASTLLARERVIAHTLDDPRLRIGFWLPLSHQYVDATGVGVTPPPRGTGLAWTPISRGGQPFAVMVHDEALDDDPELVQAAGHALQLAVTTRLIEADLERSLAELERSRHRLLEADAADRRRLERELHATAQQQLVALRVGIELTRERATANTAVAERLAGLGSSLDEAVAELRRIAGDLYSPVLADRGLAEAVRDAVRRSRRSVEVDVEDVGRLPPELEDCIYHCIVEALGNALAHGGAATPRVRLGREGDEVVFSVSDDGSGFDPDTTPYGAGLRGLVERAAAMGGIAHVVSVPGRGTVVSGSIPVPRDVAGTVQGEVS